jgi:hypothetical protein
MNKSKQGVGFLISAGIVYSLYILQMCFLGAFYPNFWGIKIWTPDLFFGTRLCVFALPFYIYVIWENYEKLYFYDFVFLVIPVFLWFILSVFVYSNKSLANIIVEPEMVAFFSGFYLLIIPISEMKLNISRKSVAFLLLLALLIATIAVAKFVPLQPE